MGNNNCFFVFLCFSLFCALASAQMLSQTNGPTTFSTQSVSTSDVRWESAEDVLALDSNSTYTNVTVMWKENTQRLLASGFLFNVPSNMTIRGIEVAWTKHQVGSGLYDESIQLVKDGTVSTATNAAGTAAWPVVANTVTTYGNNADLWKTTWTPQQINSAAFGVILRAKGGNRLDAGTPYVDGVVVTVYYAPTPTTTGTVPSTTTSRASSGSSSHTTGSATVNTTADSSSFPVGAIVGVVVGVVAFLIIGGIGTFILVRRRTQGGYDFGSGNSPSGSPPSKHTEYAATLESGTATPRATKSRSMQVNLQRATAPICNSPSKNTMVPTDSGDLAPSWQIDYNQIVLAEQLGCGSFGVVYRAKWRGSDVAVKQLLNERLNEEEMEKFILEAKVLSSLRPHSNILQFQGVCITPGRPYCIVTEFMKGGNLYDLLHSDAKLKWATVTGIIKGIAAGMLHLQSEGIVHRDLAARNILLTVDFEPKISDFGMSRFDEADHNGSKTESMVGPLKWMAPESMLERSYSIKSDVWSFGVLLFEIMTRQDPYPTLTPVEAASQVIARKAQLSLPLETTPPVILSLMEGCLQFDPADRPDFGIISQHLQALQ